MEKINEINVHKLTSKKDCCENKVQIVNFFPSLVIGLYF